MITENQYFDSNVKSLGYSTDAGKSTIGVINPGEHKFETSLREIMTIIEGELSAQFPDHEEWKVFSAGNNFEVPANSSFKVKTAVQTAYFCQYR